MRNKLKKGVAMLLTLIIAMSTTIPAFAGYGVNVIHTLKGYEVTNPKKGGEYMLYEAKDGTPLYCINFAESADTKNESGYNSNFKDNAYWRNLGFAKRSMITLAAIYGYPNNNFGVSNKMAHLATQVIIWEIQIGQRTNFSTSAWTEFNSCEGGTGRQSGNWYNSPFKDQSFVNCYNSILNACANHNTKPSFSSTTVELEGVGSKYSKTISDTNGVLNQFGISKSGQNADKLEAYISGNNLVLYAKEGCEINASLHFYRNNNPHLNENGFVIEGLNQELLWGHAEDPIAANITVKLSTGNLQITKYAPDFDYEEHQYAGISFEVYGPNGYVDTITTDYWGYAYLNNLPVGAYSVKEVTPNKFVPTNTQYVDIEAGKTANIDFVNNLKRGSLDVVKTSEDGAVEGMKFHLYGKSSDGLDVNEYATTDNNGVAHFRNIYVGSKYILEEVDTPVRYVVPEKQVGVIEWNKVTKNQFENVLKKFNVTLTKTDSETGTPQGDGSLAGAVYGIYKDGVEQARYTTDTNGSFTTDYYICDDNWTIKEITPSEGYLLDQNVYHIDAKASNFQIEHNPLSLDVTEQVIKGNVLLVKHTDDGDTQIETPEQGAEFQIYLKSASSYDGAKLTEKETLIIDSNGFATSKLLPYGVYTVHQTKSWDGRDLIDDFDVFINENGKTYSFIINNANFESYLKVTKTDVETGKTIPYAGAGFQIYNPDGSLVSMSYTYPTPVTIDTFYTNEEGYLVTPEKLPYGLGYKLVEVQAPQGYVLDATPVSFDIIESNEVVENKINLIRVDKTNMAQKGIIEIIKTGEVFVGADNVNDLYIPKYEMRNLSNATYEIYAAEDIITLDGTIRVSKGELVDTITTNENGIAKSKELYLGKYVVKEIQAPYGYVLDNNEYNVELVYAGQDVEITSTSMLMNNERQKFEISLQKVLEQDELFKVGMNGEIANAKFGLFANQDIYLNDELVIPRDGKITEAYCDENGNITFKCDLPLGYQWFVRELETDEHYILSDVKYGFETMYQGQEIDLIKIDINDDFKIDNELKRGRIEIVKKDKDTSELLAGVEFGLFDKYKNLIKTAITDENGICVFDNIPYGEYFYQELKCDDKYVIDDTFYPVSIIENEQILSFEMFNKVKLGKLVIHKIDEDTGNALSGVEFAIYDENGNLFQTFVTDEDGYYETILPYGKYTVKETKCLEGYYSNETSMDVIVESEGQVIELEITNKAIPIPPAEPQSPNTGAISPMNCLPMLSVGLIPVIKKLKKKSK